MIMVTKDLGKSNVKMLTNFAEVRVRESMFSGGIIVDGKRPF